MAIKRLRVRGWECWLRWGGCYGCGGLVCAGERVRGGGFVPPWGAGACGSGLVVADLGGGGGLSLSWGLSTPADYRCCGLGVPLGDLPTGAWLGGTLGGVYQLWVQPWGAHPVWVLQWPLHPS